MTTFKNRSVVFTIFQDRKDRFIRGPGGEVDRRTQEVARAVMLVAKTLIGSRFSGDHHRQPLEDSGTVQRSTTPGTWKVVFKGEAAEVHYTGAHRHIMPPRDAGKTAYFRAARVRFGPWRGPISHPGHRGNPYIEKAAKQLGLRISDKPVITKAATAPGVIRIPRG